MPSWPPKIEHVGKVSIGQVHKAVCDVCGAFRTASDIELVRQWARMHNLVDCPRGLQ